MKKRLVALLLCMTTVFAMTACGDSEGESVANTEVESTEEKMPVVDLAKYEYNYADYVTLCDYTAIPIELAEDYEITDEDVEAYAKEVFEYYGPFYEADESKTIIEEGDIVNVDYVGKLDGVAFDGGSAANQLIDVSGNCAAGGYTTFIDGFTDGLIGAEVGTEVDCNVTFPENYNADLAGKDAVFTFTVNSIQREVSYEEMTDAVVQENLGVESVEAFYATIREGLIEDSKYYKMQDGNADIQQYLLDNCTVDIPADYFADLMKAFRNTYVWQNCSGDETQLETFLTTNYGYTVEQAEEEWREYLTAIVEIEFILGAIADKEGVALDQEAYEASLAEYVAYYGLTSEEPLFEHYGYGDAVYGKRVLENMYIQSDLLEKLTETAVVTIAEATEESTESVTE